MLFRSSGNTFSNPQYLDKSDNSILERFDYIVANPPFSMKNWRDGLKEYGRFEGYGDTPPEKNGDYAWPVSYTHLSTWHGEVFDEFLSFGELLLFKAENRTDTFQ